MRAPTALIAVVSMVSIICRLLPHPRPKEADRLAPPRGADSTGCLPRCGGQRLLESSAVVSASASGPTQQSSGRGGHERHDRGADRGRQRRPGLEQANQVAVSSHRFLYKLAYKPTLVIAGSVDRQGV